MSCPEQWEEADDILRHGWQHPSLRLMLRADAVLREAMFDAQHSHAAMKRIGAGRTEAPTFVLRVADALDELALAASSLAAEYRRRFG
jgi:hypothetical protein